MTTATATGIIGTAHWVTSDGLRIHVWEKRRPGQAGRVALLVHGATYGGFTDFDVHVPGKDYSLMDYLAARGWDVFTLDIRGYGRSQKPQDGFSVTTAAALRDITAVADYIRSQRRNAEPLDLFGWSWGGSTTALFASRNPQRVRRLVLFAGGVPGAPTPAAQTPLEPWVVSNRESIVARIEQDAVVPEAQEAFIKAVLDGDARSPNGIRWERAEGRQRPIAGPAQITTPTLMIYGARDGAYQSEPVSAFFSKLNTPDKALVVVPNAGHFLIIQKPRMRLFRAAEDWFHQE